MCAKKKIIAINVLIFVTSKQSHGERNYQNTSCSYRKRVKLILYSSQEDEKNPVLLNAVEAEKEIHYLAHECFVISTDILSVLYNLTSQIADTGHIV